jgi:hypothetical protein
MDESDSVLETSLQISGRHYEIRVFRRSNGRHFAMTRFSDSDIIVSDGHSLEDTLRVHSCCLPLAVSCRRKDISEEPLPHPALS